MREELIEDYDYVDVEEHLPGESFNAHGKRSRKERRQQDLKTMTASHLRATAACVG